MTASFPDTDGVRSVPPKRLSWDTEGIAESIEAAVEAVRQARGVVVTTHERPDGDAIGSALAAAAVVRALGVPVWVVTADPVPDVLSFLPESDLVSRTLPSEPFDVTIVVDCSERHRVGAFPERGWADTSICLDHHATHDPAMATIIARDASAPASAELVYRFACAAGVQLTPSMATQLFCALQTDTGSFRYDSTTARALELGSRLLETNISVWPISSAIYESTPPERLALMGRVLPELTYRHEGAVAFLPVRAADLAASGATSEMADGLIKLARSVRGVEVAVQLTEEPGYWRVNLRSRGVVAVGPVAERFGGGGHINAAGCRVSGSLEEAMKALSDAFAPLLEGSDGSAT